MQFDISASTQLRNDSTETPCGLVKVQVNNSHLSFGKEAVGNIDNKLNEYWVYLPKGTKELTIKRQKYLPMKIHFKDYGINAIDSKTCYLLTLKELSYNPDKNTLVINVRPVKAKVIIDNMMIDSEDGGSYRLILEKGEHVCKITADGYRPSVQIVKTGKDVQIVDVDLESLMADVTISCETAGAELFVNNERIGMGNWVGNLPAGNIRIEARKEGFLPSHSNVTVTEKGKHKFELPALERLKGNIRIISNDMNFASVLFDGREVELENGLLQNVTSGNH